MPSALDRPPQHSFTFSDPTLPQYPTSSMVNDSRRSGHVPLPLPYLPCSTSALQSSKSETQYASSSAFPAGHITPPLDAGMSTGQFEAIRLSQYGRHAKSHSISNLGDVRSRDGSPCSKRDPLARPESRSMQSSTRSTSIIPSLQIPSTINDSQGSLAEFAAQITCLFWFESSQMLQRVEQSHHLHTPVTPLTAEAMPTTGFRKWVTTILSTTQVSQNVILLALLFVYRLKALNASVKGKDGSEYRLLTVALMLGNKFLDDNTYTNKTWAEVSGISVEEIHVMEVEFLSNMRYSLYTSKAEWQEWQAKLGRFWDYFDRASRQAAMTASKPSAFPGPSLYLDPSLPSPPASTHASPPFHSTYSPNNGGYPVPHNVPQLPPAIPSPAASMPDMDSMLRLRKRSYDEGALESPNKRLMRSMAPIPGNLMAPSRPPTHAPYNSLPNVPRLPVPPNLSTATTQSPTNYNLQASAQLPPPGGRSMGMVYPNTGLGSWGAPAFTPASTAPSLPNSHGVSISPFNEPSRRPSPYITSSTASPVNPSFSVSTPTQGRLSPSYFLTHRNSPYRPVRNVHTLLVPPPLSSIHQAPHALNANQMHYVPLGRPPNECKTGVLPHMAHESWSGTPTQWPTLQPPNFQT